MEKICEHCGDLFIAKRKDVVYCSASCRQMAYMERRLNSFSGSEDISQTQISNLSIDTSNTKPSIDISKKDSETSIDGLGEYDETSIDTLQKEKINHINKSETSLTNELINKEPIKEYHFVNSKYLNAISDLSNQRDYISILNNCIYVHKNVPCYDVGMRLKCLVECLLLFSEMKLTDIDDLKEVCNAFTLTIGSNYYKGLPDKFPYQSYIVSLRDKLKQLIIENRDDEKIQFRVSTENKIELIVTRYELSYFFTKKRFCDINFAE